MSPTWDDIEAAALTDPTLHQLVTLVRHGYLTREEGLIATVLGLVYLKNRQQARILDLLNTRVPAPVVGLSEVLRNP